MDELSIWSGIIALVGLVLFAGSFGLALSYNRALQEETPGNRRYLWGYFFGISLAVIGVSLWSLVFVLDRIEWRLLASLLPAIVIASGVYIVQRRRWAWVLGTVLSLMPIIWLVNAIYGRNRWDEFDQQGSRIEDDPSRPRNEPQLVRRPIGNATVASATTNVNADGDTNRPKEPAKEDYARALDEVESAKVDRGLWAQALAETEGDMQKAKARYIRLRAQQAVK